MKYWRLAIHIFFHNNKNLKRLLAKDKENWRKSKSRYDILTKFEDKKESGGRITGLGSKFNTWVPATSNINELKDTVLHRTRKVSLSEGTKNCRRLGLEIKTCQKTKYRTVKSPGPLSHWKPSGNNPFPHS